MSLHVWGLITAVFVVVVGWRIHLVERRRQEALRLYREHCTERFLRGERTECPCRACELARCIWFGPRVG